MCAPVNAVVDRCADLVSSGHLGTRPHHRVRGYESAAARQVSELPAHSQTGRSTVTVLWVFLPLRVRLVERGSPHSLPLMESGKVTRVFPLPTGKKEKNAVLMFCVVQILPGVRIIIANPETKGPMGESHLGEVGFSCSRDSDLIGCRGLVDI